MSALVVLIIWIAGHAGRNDGHAHAGIQLVAGLLLWVVFAAALRFIIFVADFARWG